MPHTICKYTYVQYFLLHFPSTKPLAYIACHMCKYIWAIGFIQNLHIWVRIPRRNIMQIVQDHCLALALFFEFCNPLQFFLLSDSILDDFVLLSHINRLERSIDSSLLEYVFNISRPLFLAPGTMHGSLRIVFVSHGVDQR
jgi:hypothetical protein